MPDQNGQVHKLSDYKGQLSAPEKKALQEYDVWKERSMFGKPVMGIERSTYLIDEDGVIIKAFGKVKPKDNAGQMLKELS